MSSSATAVLRSALVVEDEPLIRLAAVDLCEVAGLVVAEASNADQAIALMLSNDRYALLLTDIDMPGSMDGVALAWRARELIPSIAVIVVSGKTIARESDLPPNSQFFSKPVQDATILASIAELLVMQ